MTLPVLLTSGPGVSDTLALDKSNRADRDVAATGNFHHQAMEFNFVSVCYNKKLQHTVEKLSQKNSLNVFLSFFPA